jgi:hypothetical protein
MTGRLKAKQKSSRILSQPIRTIDDRYCGYLAIKSNIEFEQAFSGSTEICGFMRKPLLRAG